MDGLETLTLRTIAQHWIRNNREFGFKITTISSSVCQNKKWWIVDGFDEKKRVWRVTDNLGKKGRKYPPNQDWDGLTWRRMYTYYLWDDWLALLERRQKAFETKEPKVHSYQFLTKLAGDTTTESFTSKEEAIIHAMRNGWYLLGRVKKTNDDSIRNTSTSQEG